MIKEAIDRILQLAGPKTVEVDGLTYSGRSDGSLSIVAPPAIGTLDATTLPVIFAALMGLSILLYVILDGFDLGVGLLFPFATPEERDRMIAYIGVIFYLARRAAEGKSPTREDPRRDTPIAVPAE